jgi:hypothetical protein
VQKGAGCKGGREGGRDYVDERYMKTGVWDKENYLITVSTIYVLRLSMCA